ncbi:VirK/YbjX family protein [Rahnella sp. PD12R]|uniref:VirK/YbjX family protein n=1 Tax=Rahnella sp. PD12R TaxID=2855688 RepID=UPI001C443BD7|nr:VirK/YbjX family protein [Rahnella sp. PD12R]MBV6821193.1 VirK/YbjX family protein [Rahnella sp. PD12R]
MTTFSYPSTEKAPLSGLQLMTALLSCRTVPGPSWKLPRYRFKFLYRALLHPRRTFAMLDYLAHHPQRDEILAAMPSLPCKLHRIYQTANITPEQAMKRITDHYDMIGHCLPDAINHGYLSKKEMAIATLTGKEEQRYAITFNAIARLDKEGEATLTFHNAEGVSIAIVTFSFIEYQGKPTLFIGALQGPKANVDHQEIQRATKACHGLFPKRLVIEALTTLADVTGMTQLVAVGNHTHIYENPRYKKRKGMVFADYDSFWETMEAKPGEDGYFHLPRQIAHRPLEEIASKRRSEYRRRYQLLDDLESQIRQTFTRGHGNPVTTQETRAA